MFDTWEIVGALAGLGSFIVGVAALAYLFRKPRVSFSLQKAIMRIKIDGKQERLSFLIAHVENRRKVLLGDTARKVKCQAIRRSAFSPTEAYTFELPWIKSYGETIKVSKELS